MRSIIVIFIVLIFGFPIYWLVAGSLKSDFEMSLNPPTMFPEELHFENFIAVWDRLDFLDVFKNSLFVSLTTTALIILFCSMGGYSLAKKNIKGKKILTTLILSTMIVPPTVLLIPLYFIITEIGLFDSLWGIILPFAVTSFGLVFMKQYIEGIPDELLEASRIDGCNEYRIFFTIVMPLLKPAIATLAIIEFSNNWNSFMMPLVLIKDTKLYTIPLKLASITNASDVMSWSQILSANVLAIIPVVILFLCTQKLFISGLMAGSVKG
ncbi:hypothetical protein AN639_12095 [Candidatus Epulonipiscium fishelsonii]|uniref:Uncharacterized protein n=1 Tax=Candidatus Epulonipiscium fishelsonii TaxID=77094 RepID=A0ACC8X7Q9_9FIRM|nr:hypothetical protein AN396_12535 [Epulopiscium sp. SCG-B11WGA-EpuloA1]ONI42668.1 hypothetical protein AN639_12095 [Epulopiscium sp. SCG-B05WGA-EpuloA1]